MLVGVGWQLELCSELLLALVNRNKFWYGLDQPLGAQAFVVDSDVLTAFLAVDDDLQHCFRPCPQSSGKWLADIYGLARCQLKSVGVTQVYGGDYCTYTDSKRFFSYRRDATYGRMASLIWIR